MFIIVINKNNYCTRIDAAKKVALFNVNLKAMKKVVTLGKYPLHTIYFDDLCRPFCCSESQAQNCLEFNTCHF